LLVDLFKVDKIVHVREDFEHMPDGHVVPNEMGDYIFMI
jgi:hypothetical protein